jgi:hypothetical protein
MHHCAHTVVIAFGIGHVQHTARRYAMPNCVSWRPGPEQNPAIAMCALASQAKPEFESKQ